MHENTRPQRRGYLELLAFAAAWLLAAAAMADTHRWIGAADPVTQEDTITVSGTWAADDTATVTCNDKTVTVTVGTDTATTDVAQIIAAAIDAASATAGLVNDEERNRGGEEIPEFTEMDAVAESNVVTVSGATPGVPFTITVSESTAGSGALALATGGSGASVACTGPEYFDNAANWINDAGAAALPADSDTIRYDVPAADCKYNIDYSGTATNLRFERTTGYQGNIGLTAENPGGYPEYRTPRFLVLEDDGILATQQIHVNLPGPLAPRGYTYLDLDATTPTSNRLVRIYAGPGLGDDGAGVQIVGGPNCNVELLGGTADVGTHPQENATTMLTAQCSGQQSVLRIGSNAAFANTAVSLLGNLTVAGGNCILETDCSGANNDVFVQSGTLQTAADVDLTDISIYGGTLTSKTLAVSGVLTLHGGGATLDLSEAVASGTVSNPIELYRGSIVRDPKGLTIGDSYDFNGYSPDANFEVRGNIRAAITGL